eukprot:GFUD01025128.1.p1 GENE.GFUD01025128.1~~GFUD01025128.1.p1  ORF type:complete len:519 (+),score=111.99 GFUD01025128.1:163-1719(+)
MMATTDKTLLVGADTHVFKRRWYILAIFSFLALFQCCVWNTWGPVVDIVDLVYPAWSEQTVSLFANWGSISFLVFMVPVLYLQDVSLRSSIVLSSSLVALGTALRCLFLVFPGLSDSHFTILCHLSAILNGIPGIIVTSAPPAVSAAWFPPDERVTATSISQMLNNIGQGLSFLIASLMITDPKQERNSSVITNTSCEVPSDTPHHLYEISQIARNTLKLEIENYMLVLSVPALVLFICTVLYFPSKPSKPPSRSSTEQRLDFVAGCKQLLKNPASWLIAIVWSIPQAIWNNWCAMMVVSLTKVGYHGECLSEKWVNHLGMVAVVVGTAMAILVGMATDKIKGKMKLTIIILLTAGGCMFTILSLISLQVIVFESMLVLKVTVYCFLLLGNSFVVSTSPLLMEFGVEKLYPISEGMIGGWLNIWYNIISVLFLGLFSLPNIGTKWLSYVLPISCFMVIPLFMTIKEEYKRRSIDEEEDICGEDTDEESVSVDTNYNLENEPDEENITGESVSNYVYFK